MQRYRMPFLPKFCIGCMGVASRGPGVPVTPLCKPLCKQTTYNIRVRKRHDDILAAKAIVENPTILKCVLYQSIFLSGSCI